MLNSVRDRSAALKLFMCAMALGFLVSVGQSLTIPVPDTIMLPDSLGPLRPPYHVAFGSSTDNIYVASESSDIIVVDGNTFQRIERIYTGAGGGDAMLVDQHNRLYVSHPSQGRIGVIDCATNNVVGSILVGTRPKLLCYSSGSDKLYCGDTIDRTVTVIDCAADTVCKVISVGKGLAAMVYDPTTSKMYAATRDGVLAISCSADSIVSTISSVKSASGLCINKRRQKLYAAGQHAPPDTLFVISTVTDSAIAREPIAGELWPPLACNELTNRLYGMFGGSEMCVYEFDCVGDTLIRFEPAAGSAKTLALFCDSVRNRLYCLYQSGDGGSLIALECATLKVIYHVPMGFYPEVLHDDPARYRIIHAGGTSEAAVLTVFDYKGDSLYARGATPLSGWTQDMCHNSVSGKLYYWWGYGYGVSGVGVIDELTNRLESQVFLSLTESWQQTYSRTSNKLYFLAMSRGLGVMDGSRDSLIKVIEMGYPGTGLRPCWCPDANKVYCSANKGARRYIAAVDCRTDSVVREIDIYDYFESFEYLGAGRILCRQWKHLTLIDSRADTVLVDSAVEASEYRAIAHTDDGEKLYIALHGRLEVRSSSALALLSTIYWPYAGNLGGGSLVCSDATHKLYWFSDNADSTLAIDTRGDTVVARMPLGGCRALSCLDRTGRYLFCFSSYVRVYDTRTDSLVAMNSLSLRPLSVTPNPEQGSIYVGCQDAILVYPDVPPGVEETPSAQSGLTNSGPTVVREVLVLNELGTRSELSDNSVMSRAVLLDISGRKVMDLHAGANDVRGLAPGVYFVLQAQAQAGSRPPVVRKVVVTR
jgi:DNA-binding beta-propeller fold protein YncE